MTDASGNLPGDLPAHMLSLDAATEAELIDAGNMDDKPEDAAEDILRSERQQAREASARHPKQILFLLKEKMESDHSVLTVAIGREQAKRQVQQQRLLTGDPDWWLVTPLTRPGERVSVTNELSERGEHTHEDPTRSVN